MKVFIVESENRLIDDNRKKYTVRVKFLVVN
jgi:hypothetical protein